MRGDTPQEEHYDLIADVLFHKGHVETHLRYANILRGAVFAQVTVTSDNIKEHKAYQKKLLEFESYQVLVLIWIGSEHACRVSPASDVCRPLITCHSIAKRVGYSDNLKAANEAVSVICRAAETYGLLTKNAIAKNKIDLHGTLLLHSVMTGMRQPFAESCIKIFPATIEASSKMLSQE